MADDRMMTAVDIAARAMGGDYGDPLCPASRFSAPLIREENRRGPSAQARCRCQVEDRLVDLFQLHRPDTDTDVEETLATLTDLMAAGKVRAIGGSSYPASAIVEAQWVAERRGLARFRTEQPPYSILNRAIEREVLPTCERYGMGTLVYSPLAGGLLTGRYRAGEGRRTGPATAFSTSRTRAGSTWSSSSCPSQRRPACR